MQQPAAPPFTGPLRPGSPAAADDEAPVAMFAWELGGGLGHVAKGLLLAAELAVQGTEVSFAVRDLAATHPLLPEASHRLYQAPVCWLRLKGAPEPANYAELLLHAGFGDRAALKGLVRGWLTLFEADRTRLVIADHAPSAVLAARCAGLPVVRFGHGFFAPPPAWPVFRTWESPPEDRLARARQDVLACMNDCLAAFGAAPLDDAADLFAASASFLCTTPEFDHYPGRQDVASGPGTAADTFVGTLWVDHVGRPAEWPGGDLAPHRVFAYLRPGLPGLEDVLSALTRSRAAVLVMSPGIAPATVARWQGAGLRFTRELVALRDVARQADLVVCSGSDTLHGLAQSGVPVLGLPINAEQRIAAERVRETGAGRWLLPGTDAEAVLASLRDLLDAPHYRDAALRLKARHPRHDAGARLAPVVAACRAHLGAGATAGQEVGHNKNK